jgi:predicted site-specific integrase-resolvase
MSRRAIHPEDLVASGEFTHTLRIDRSTLTRWVQTGRIVPVVIGGTRFFYRADMERIAAERAASA